MSLSPQKWPRYMESWRCHHMETLSTLLPFEIRIHRSSVDFHHKRPGPCITNIIATCRKNFSQWERSFLWKLRCHWLELLRRVAKTLVIQGPVVKTFESNEWWCETPRRSCDISVMAELQFTCYNKKYSTDKISWNTLVVLWQRS